jgi:predicted PurR-regulated permease PerM
VHSNQSVELRIPFATLVKVALFILLCLIAIKLFPIVIMMTVSALLAVMLDPAVTWMERHSMRRGVAIALLAIVMFGLLAALVFMVVPVAVGQMRQLGKELPRLVQEISRRVPAVEPYIAPLSQMAQRPPTGPQVEQLLTRGLVAGRFTIVALGSLILTLVIALYLLIDGRRALEWLIVFAPPEPRKKLRRTLIEVRPIILAYMRGLAITCSLCATMTFTTLSILHIPGAVPLAVLAFVADLVPVIGTIVMMVPAVAFAMVVSPLKALIVLAAYLGYHLLEAYVIIPRVYGREMRVSTLTVLLAVTVGATLQGALGAVLILPFVAAYPVIEEIWLQKLGDTVDEHERIEER